MTTLLQNCWGRLIVPKADGHQDLVFDISKPLIYIGR